MPKTTQQGQLSIPEAVEAVRKAVEEVSDAAVRYAAGEDPDTMITHRAREGLDAALMSFANAVLRGAGVQCIERD